MRTTTSQPKLVWNHFPEISKALEKELSVVLEKTARDLQAQSSMRAPYETGQLSASSDVTRPEALLREVVYSAEHAVYQEFGTGERGAQSSYPWPVDVAYRSGWAGIEARAFLGTPAKAMEPTFVRACEMAVQRAGRAK